MCVCAVLDGWGLWGDATRGLVKEDGVVVPFGAAASLHDQGIIVGVSCECHIVQGCIHNGIGVHADAVQ